MPFGFSVEASDGKARAGQLTTPHGTVPTPLFMTVGTQATVKGILPTALRSLGAPVLLANAYHLSLRPGEQIVRELGGLHGMMSWDGPILTDSGGFQLFSLADRCKLDDDGVTFRSHIDGSELRMTPERATEIQQALGADMFMCFDQCLRNPAPRDEAVVAVERTLAWAARCRAVHEDQTQALFGIVQGATFDDLRERCAAGLREIGFFGYAVGGLSVGEGKAEMRRVLDGVDGRLPGESPRYLMGVGPPEDLVDAIAAGVDMFDCVLPTRNGRAAQALTWDGPINLKNAKWARDPHPIDPDCALPELQGFSRGTLRHYFKSNEMLGPILVSIHNLWFVQQLMARTREAICEGRFEAFREAFLARYLAGKR